MASHPTSERLTFERRDGRLGPAIGMHTAFSGLPATFTGSTGTKHRGEHPRLVSPRAYLSSPISARKRDVGLQSQIGASFRILESDISGNTEGRDPVAALEVYKWPQEFDLSYDYCFDLVLLRLRSSLIDSSGDTDLADHSSILAKYIDPVLNFVNRDIFDPHGANGPLIYREVQTGTSRIFILGFHVDQPSRDWDPNPKWVNSPSELTMNKRALTVGIFLEPGTIHKMEFSSDSYPLILPSGSGIGIAVSELMRLCDVTGASYGFLTDEITSVIYDNTERMPSNCAVLQLIDTSEMSVRLMLANILWIEACRFGVNTSSLSRPTSRCHGALQKQVVSLPDGQTKEYVLFEMAVHPDRGILKKTFSQFDYYTLQRCRAAWKCFLEWKRAVEVEANHSPLKPGMKLKIEWRGVEKRYTLWRAELDVYHQQIPEESSGIATQYTRPKDNPLKGCIEGNSSELWFDVAEARKIGPRRFSQILFGRICGKGPLLCLKLFDERHFPYPDDSDNPDAPKVDWGAPPSQRLLDLHFAVDMVRREESAFDRLKDFQGSLIPHFFGNHFFTLANDWVFPGVLMEVIEGPVFGECDVDGWTTEEQRSFVTHVRHGLRVLKFAGIEQTDWHEGQIMCPLNSFGQRHAVFMDFAFANQRLGEHKGKPVTDDAEWLKLLLTDCGIDEEVMKECWFDLVDEER